MSPLAIALLHQDDKGAITDDGNKKLPKVAEVGIRTGVRLIISLLRSQSRVDPELRQEALDFFLEILRFLAQRAHTARYIY